MSGGQIAVVGVWLAFIATALSSGLSMGTASPLRPDGGEPFPPPNIALILLSFGFVASSGVFLLRRVISYSHSWAARFIDWAWGAGTWEAIILRLKPVLLLIVGSYIAGVVGTISTYMNSQSWTAYVNSAFGLSVALGLTFAYCISRRFPPTLV
jgi:UDP-N-acetylglucosamine:LPS N-acetylglucosamine transferase